MELPLLFSANNLSRTDGLVENQRGKPSGAYSSPFLSLAKYRTDTTGKRSLGLRWTVASSQGVWRERLLMSEHALQRWAQISDGCASQRFGKNRYFFICMRGQLRRRH